jgi:hypothetical protein
MTEKQTKLLLEIAKALVRTAINPNELETAIEAAAAELFAESGKTAGRPNAA